MILLASFPFVNFYLHNIGCAAIEATWRSDDINSFDLQEALLHGLDQARQHHVSGWVADDRRLSPILPSDLLWITTNVLPALADMGVKRLAVVDSEDPLNRELIHDAYHVPLAALGIEIHHFLDLRQARTWACGKR
jgi:hypothetical protein